MESDGKFPLPPPFDEAVRRHEHELMRYLMRATRNREDALDVFQEMWLRAYRAWPTLASADGLRPWLYRIATNLCLNRNRDRMRRVRVIAEDAPEFVTETSSVNGSNEAVIHLRDAIAALPRKQREAFVMRKFGGLDYEEIAAALACSPESARAGVYQALRKLRAAAGG